MTPEEIVLEFIRRVNERDTDRLAELMTDDHVFTDSLANSMRGRDEMRSAWRAYFKFCPDYRIEHEEILSSGSVVVVFGTAGGTLAAEGELPAGNVWRVAAAWRAGVENDSVKTWRVYADLKPVYDIIARSPRVRAE